MKFSIIGLSLMLVVKMNASYRPDAESSNVDQTNNLANVNAMRILMDLVRHSLANPGERLSREKAMQTLFALAKITSQIKLESEVQHLVRLKVIDQPITCQVHEQVKRHYSQWHSRMKTESEVSQALRPGIDNVKMLIQQQQEQAKIIFQDLVAQENAQHISMASAAQNPQVMPCSLWLNMQQRTPQTYSRTNN